MTPTGGQPQALADLAHAVTAELVVRGLTIAVAESCTGGLICATLCELEGASRFLVGGVVAYANVLKTGLLSIPAAVLAEHGAASAPVALAMAQGMRAAAGSDLALGVSGLAGPQVGRRSRKAVGTVYVALTGGPRGDQWREYRWGGGRAENMRSSTTAALRLIHEELSFG